MLPPKRFKLSRRSIIKLRRAKVFPPQSKAAHEKADPKRVDNKIERSPTLPQKDTGKKIRFWQMLANTPRLLQLVCRAAPRLFLLSVSLTLLAAVVPILQLYVSKLIIDGVTARLGQDVINWQPLLFLLAAGLGLSLAQTGLTQAKGYTSQVLNDRFTLHANHVLLRQATRLDLAHYEQPEFYDILNRAQESGSSYPVKVMETLTTLAGQLITLAGLVILLLQFNPLMLMLLLITSLPNFWMGVSFSSRRFWMMRRQTQSGRMADYLQKILTNSAFAKEVRLFDLGEYLLQQWQQIRSQFNQESAQLAAKQASTRFAVSLLAQFGFYGAYTWVLVQTVRGAITLGDLTLYSGAFQQSQNLMQSLLLNIAIIYEHNLYVSQYFEFLSLQPQVINPPQPLFFPSPMQLGLALRHVTFTYPDASEPTLYNLNLTVKPGESIALVGENGAGKTTLLKVITRLYDIDQGEITIDGIPIQRFDLKDLRRNVGVVFQDFARYNLSVQDNIGFGDLRHRDDLQRIKQAAKDAGAKRMIMQLSKKYQTILGKTFPDSAELSGGQWQKIGLSRAFMSPAQILILDEPTAALDAIAEHDLFQRFRQLAQGKMTFLVSHRFSTVRMADRIVVLERGRIVEVGSHDELIAQKTLYADMFHLQAASYH